MNDAPRSPGAVEDDLPEQMRVRREKRERLIAEPGTTDRSSGQSCRRTRIPASTSPSRDG
jgi:hypothetical protein